MSDLSAAPNPPTVCAFGLDALAVGRSIFGNNVLPQPPQVEGFSEISLLAVGGFGVVWRARREGDGTEVALKAPHQSDPATSEQMEAEGDTLRSLAHPNIVRLYEITAAADGAPVLVMELVDGPPLTSRLPDEGFDFDHTLQIFLPVLNAVGHAHARGIVHRDLKPSNILLAADGTPKVTDFGLAQPLQEQRVSFPMTQTGLLAGTVEYLAPERYNPDARIGAAADIYALGVVLYELLTGRPPRGAWRAPSQIKRLDVRLDELILDAIHSDPDKRLPSVEIFRRRLEDIRDTRARYSGTPMVTRPIRYGDFVWTVMGLYCLFAGYCSLEATNNTEMPGIFDLTFRHTQLLGGFWAVWVLSVLMGMVWTWQIIRLLRFRCVPLREALPSPFGLRTGRSRGAAVLAGGAQLLCAWGPLIYMVLIYAQVWFWAAPETAAWERVLAVTPWDHNETPVSPWTWDPRGMFSGDEYYIREMNPGYADRSWHFMDRQSFYVFTQPLLMALGVAAIGTGMLLTLTFAVLQWRRWAVLRLLPVLAAGTATGFHLHDAVREESATHAAIHSKRSIAPWRELEARERRWIPFVKELYFDFYHDETRQKPLPPECFAPVITVRGDKPMERETFLKELESARYGPPEMRATWKSVLDRFAEPPRGFNVREFLSEYCTEDASGLAIGGFETTLIQGRTAADKSGGFIITGWNMDRKVLYTALARRLRPAEAEEWLGSLLDSMAGEGCPGLEGYFLPVVLAPGILRDVREQYGAHFPVVSDQIVSRFRTSRAEWSNLDFSTNRAPKLQELPGARWQLECAIVQNGTRRSGRTSNGDPLRWLIEVVFTSGRWRILRLRM